MDYLEHLASLLSCEYLSDLRYQAIAPDQADRVLSDSEEFPAEQYIKAARYIIGSKEPDYPSALEARRAIVNYLTRTG